MNRFFKFSTLVSLGTYLLPLALLALLLALNSGSTESGLEFKDLKWTLLFWMACAGLFAFGTLVVGGAVFADNPKRDVWFPLIATSVVVVVLLGIVEAAIRFAIGNENLSTALVGLSSFDQLEQAVAYTNKGPLPSEAMERLEGIWSAL